MPIHVKVINNEGSFNGVMINGHCNYYNTTDNIIMKGNFEMNKLAGTNNILIEFTDTSFIYYYGEFINNRPDGSIIVYEYTGSDNLRDITSISVQKKNCIYDAGNLTSVISEESIMVNIEINYKYVNSNYFITEFILTEI